MLYAELLNTYGDITANVTMCGFLIAGTIVTAIIKSDLRRQAAQTVQNSAA
jgi:FLVCR family feline leukemia virus subgroup C receptor-related protein